jgi:hypothetical protein
VWQIPALIAEFVNIPYTYCLLLETQFIDVVGDCRSESLVDESHSEVHVLINVISVLNKAWSVLC